MTECATTVESRLLLSAWRARLRGSFGTPAMLILASALLAGCMSGPRALQETRP
jgi:starvation-inducible outer membrane lipoprotein